MRYIKPVAVRGDEGRGEKKKGKKEKKMKGKEQGTPCFSH